jgi:hypothetical protein
MSFIELPGINEVQEKVVVPEGLYDLVITSNPSPKKNETSGKTNLLCVLAIDGKPDAANVMHNLSLISADDEDETKKFKLLQIKRFCHWFGIDISDGLNTENFAGSRSLKSMPLIVEEYKGELKNTMRLPPLPTE